MSKGGATEFKSPPARGALCALILAAGLSTRMKPLLQGGSKALCGLQGKLLLERCCGVFKKAGLERIYVVTGHESEAVSSLAQKLGAIPIYNADFQEGMFSSIKAGLQQVAQNPQNQSFFLLPVDIPLLKSALLEALMGRWEALGEARQNAIIIPEVQGVPGHPPLIGRGHWSSIMQWGGQGGLQGYVASFQAMTGHESLGVSAVPRESENLSEPGKNNESESLGVSEGLGIYRLDVDDKTVLWDIDTPADLEKAALYLKESGI